MLNAGLPRKFFSLCSDLLKEMLAEEDQLKNKMKLRSEEYGKELAQLCIDLDVPLRQVRTNCPGTLTDKFF